MATYRIKRLQSSPTPDEIRFNWVGTFDDEFDAREEAQKLAAAETSDNVFEYVVCRVFTKNPPQHLASYPVKKPNR